MSASDKKKQRKDEVGAGLTQREIKEQAQAAAAKRKKTIYTVVGVVCAVAAAALLVWNSGFWEKGAVAATVDGKDYKVPDLQYYYVQARNSEYSMYQLYAQYGMTSGYDPAKTDGEQWYNEGEGKTYADYFRESALDSLKQVTALCKAASAEGYTLSDDGQKQIDETLAQIDVVCAQNGLTRGSYFAQVYGKGVTEKVFTQNLTNAVLASEYQQYHQDNISYADADLQAYYDEHPNDLDSYDYRAFYIDGSAADPTDDNGDPLTDEEGNTITATDEEKAAAKAAAKEKADAAVAEIQAASDRDAAMVAAAPNYVAETSKEAYADPAYSLQEGVPGNVLTQNAASIASWLMDAQRESGDVAAIEASSGYYVVLFKDRYLSQDPTVDIRHILIRAETTDEDETDANGNKIPSQAAIDAAKAEAEALLAEWKAGDATEESFAALAKEHSDDTGSASNGGEYTYVAEGSMVPNFNDWIFDPARQPGDTGLVENLGDGANGGYYGWHIIYFEQVQEPAWKNTAITAKQSTDQSAWMEEITGAVEAVAADGMKYVGDKNTAAPTATPTPAESVEPTESEAPADSQEPSESPAE